MIERARTFADAVDRELVKPDHGAARGEVHVERGLAARGGGAVRDAGRGHERGPVHVVVHLVGVYALAVGRVELDDLRSYMRECQPYADGGGQKIEEKKRGRGGRGEGTHAAGFWDFDDGDAVAVRALHLDVEFFVPDDEDGVYCAVCGERARLYARGARDAWSECARASRAE